MTETFKNATGLLKLFARDPNGTTAIEYAVIAAGISVAIVAAVTGVGSEVNSLFASVHGNF